MADHHDSLQASRLSESSPQFLPQIHRFDNVNLSGNVSAILGDVHHYHNFQQAQDSQSRGQALKALLSDLAFPEMQSRFQTLNDPYPDTFKWILDPIENDEESLEEVSDWMDTVKWDSLTEWLSDGTSPYWISGKLGTGKSTLMKYLTEKLSDSQSGYGETKDAILLSHFFWAPGSNLQNSVLGCLRTLLWQLLQVGDGKYERPCPFNSGNLAPIARLRDGFVKTIQTLDKTLVILLDGLDECREIDEILDVVEILAALPNVKLCVSSRREEVFMLQFSDFAKLKLQDLNRRDIVRFVKTELLENPRVRRSPSWNPNTANDLAEAVIDNAEGVFLWVRLVIKELFRGWTNRDDLPRMHKRLQKLPQDIYSLYKELTKRDQGAATEYASEAAVYYQLLKLNGEHRLPLATFFFATNDTVRARYLDIDKVFHVSLTELEEDVDLETLVAWINVRSAGLLEVKQDYDMFYFNNDNRPGPFGRFLEFDTHWVTFIHRSAYTYLHETSEGQKAMMEISMTSHTLDSVYFESQVCAKLILPGTYNFRFVHRFHQGIGLLDLFPHHSHKYLPEKTQCRLLQKVFDNLFEKGLILVAADWLDPLHRNYHLQYPTSLHGSVDLCRVFAGEETATAQFMDTFVEQYGCEDDHVYMFDVMLTFLRRQLQDAADVQSYNGHGHGVDILSRFRKIANLASMTNTMKMTPSSEKVSFAQQLATTASVFAGHDHEIVDAIWQILPPELAEDLPLLLPTCKELIAACLELSGEVAVLAALSISTLRAWTKCQDTGEYSSLGRALFYLESPKEEKGKDTYRMIDLVDSDDVLERLRLMVLSRTQGRASLVRGSYDWWIEDTACFVLVGDHEMIVSKGLTASFLRGPRYNAFVDCLQYIGKSKETIAYTVGEQVTIAAHNNWDPFRSSAFFHQLLGTDREVLASWIEKYPTLADCPGMLQA